MIKDSASLLLICDDFSANGFVFKILHVLFYGYTLAVAVITGKYRSEHQEPNPYPYCSRERHRWAPERCFLRPLRISQ